MIRLPMDSATFLRLRKRLKFDREELALVIGVTEKQIRNYENGNRAVPEWIAKLVIMFARHGVPDDFGSFEE